MVIGHRFVRGCANQRGELPRHSLSTRNVASRNMAATLVTERRHSVARPYYCSTEIYCTGQGLATFSLLSINGSCWLIICYALTIGVSACLSFACPDFLYVAPDKDAGVSPSPVLPALSELPFSPGFVADFLNDCSKSAMMSSMCSVPTEIRMRSCNTN